MNKPLMLNPGTIPPAQAEALHDIALETETLGRRFRAAPISTSALAEEWEDEETDDGKALSGRSAAESRPYPKAQHRPSSSNKSR